MLYIFYCVIESVGLSAVTLLVCLINALQVVSLAKLYVIKNLNLNLIYQVQANELDYIFNANESIMKLNSI